MKYRIFLLLSAFVLLSLTGCGLLKPRKPDNGQSKDFNFPVTVCGVTLEKPPQSAVVLSPSLAEIISDMGFGEFLTGRSKECDFPEAVAALPPVGGVLIPDIDIITQLAPEVLLTQAKPSDSVNKMLEANGITVIVIPAAKRFEELQTVYTNVAQIFSGGQTGLTKGIAHMEALKDSLKPITDAAASAAGEKPLSAVYITDNYGHAATGDTVLHRLILAAGADNAASADREWTPDKQSLNKAQVIFCPEQIVKEIKSMADLAECPAVKNGRVYGLNAAAMERQSRRMIDAVKDMALKMYPGAFEADTTTGQASTTAAAQ